MAMAERHFCQIGLRQRQTSAFSCGCLACCSAVPYCKYMSELAATVPAPARIYLHVQYCNELAFITIDQLS